MTDLHKVEQVLGKAIKCPPYYPELSSVDDGEVCVGELVPEVLAIIVVKQRDELQQRVKELEKTLHLVAARHAWSNPHFNGPCQCPGHSQAYSLLKGTEYAGKAQDGIE